MNYTLENDFIKIEVSTFGAELKSLFNKKSNLELLWDANPKYWKRNAPVLFPNVGKYKDGIFRYNGETFKQGAHGFARDNEFVLENINSNSITLSFSYNENTLINYPFKFKLEINYLLDLNSVRVTYRIHNLDNKTIYFGIGGHPAFKCPLNEGEDRQNYYLKFYKDKLINSIVNEKGLKTNLKEEIELDNGFLKLDNDLFKYDTVVLEKQDIREISLCDSNRNPYITINSNCPLFGVWGGAINSPFISIEPWFGAFDSEDFEGEISEKDYESDLAEHEISEKIYIITLN